MQLFITNVDPVLAAQDLDDARVVKIILEVAQILCTVLNQQGEVTPYKSSHQHHPITKWVAADPANAKWAVNYGLELCSIYRRWRNRSHASEAVIGDVACLLDFRNCSDLPGSFQNSAKGHGLDFTHLPVIEAYRCYLTARWLTGKTVPRWTNRSLPKWFCQETSR